jgi:hypothetical protein
VIGGTATAGARHACAAPPRTARQNRFHRCHTRHRTPGGYRACAGREFLDGFAPAQVRYFASFTSSSQVADECTGVGLWGRTAQTFGDPVSKLDPRAQAQLAARVAQVGLDSTVADEHLGRDLWVGQTLSG